MTEIIRDNNQITVVAGVLNTDGTTPTLIKINPTTHKLDMSDGSTGSDLGADNAVRDNSGIPILIAVSNVDGSTPVPLYVNSSGQLMVKST